MKKLMACLVAVGFSPTVAQAAWQMPAVKVPKALTSQVTDSSKAGCAPWAWYDASSADYFTFVQGGGVTNWLDRGAQKHDAIAYKPTMYPAEDPIAYGTWGETNGVPAYRMGARQSKIDLKFSRCTKIRTVFWVVDLDWRSFLLSDSSSQWHFHRSGGTKTDPGSANWGLFNSYSKFCQKGALVRLDGRTVPYDEPVYPGTRHLIAAIPEDGVAVTADSLSNDRNDTGNNDRTGGRALSELIIFNRDLTADEFAEIEVYLGVKWFNATTNLAAVTVVGTGVLFPNLCVEEGASFVCSSAAIGAGTPEVNVMGTLSKTAEKIVFTWTGAVPTRSSAVTLLSCAAAESLTREDFDLQGFPADATVRWSGTELVVFFPGTHLLPAALAPVDAENAPRMWLDAASPTNFVFTDEGGVATWLDRSGRAHHATAYLARPSVNPNPDISYGDWSATNGVPAYCMGPRKSQIDMSFDRLSDIRTVFSVVDIDRRCFLLGDSGYYDFHRQSPGENLTGNDDNDYGLFADSASSFADESVRRVFGVPVRMRYPLFPGTRYLISLVSTANVHANRLAADRGDAYDDRTGGRALSELIVFNRVLTDGEIVDVENYLGAKWFDATTNLVETATVPATGLTYPNLTVDAGGSFAVNAADVTRGQPCVKVYGTLRKGTAEKIRVAWTGGLRRATLLTCAASDGLTADDFELTGDAVGGKLLWDGRTLSTPPTGLVLIFR